MRAPVDLHRGRRPPAVAPNSNNGQALPADETIEAAILGIILEQGAANPQEAERLMMQLRPALFYDLRHQAIHAALAAMLMADPPHAISLLTLMSWIKGKERDCGGELYLMELPLKALPLAQFDELRRQLVSLATRRWASTHLGRMSETARTGDIDLAALNRELSSTLEKVEAGQNRERPVIEFVTLRDIQAYKPDPRSWLIGADMICLGELSLIAGLPESGKSMLGNTLAVAGARGRNEWMGYAVRRKFRTLIVQSEGSMNRMQKELLTAEPALTDFIQWSKPCHLAFSDPHFRQAIRRKFDAWPFDLIIIDNWSDCVTDDKFTDYQQGLDNIRAALPTGDKAPAVLILAHLSKAVIKSDKPLTGRVLMAHVSGSFRLGQKARTVFTLVRAFPELGDDDKVIFDCAKANNDVPLGVSAWHRRPVEFTPCRDFDFDTWANPPEDQGKGSISEDDMRAPEVFDGGRRKLKRKNAAAELKALGFSQANVYRALDCERGKFKEHLAEEDGLLVWRD